MAFKTPGHLKTNRKIKATKQKIKDVKALRAHKMGKSVGTAGASSAINRAASRLGVGVEQFSQPAPKRGKKGKKR